MIQLDTLGTVALRTPDGRELHSILAQPKRLAVLAYLAVESAHGPQRRDRLFSLFWPELNQAQARQALRQSLYVLRRSLGADAVVNRGAEEVGVDARALQCDVRVFMDRLDEGRLDEALALYRGGFLHGFFVTDASAEFEQWVDATRARLERRAIDAAWTLADGSERAGHAAEAVRWARYAANLAPNDERSLQRLIALFDRQGDRAGALRA
ncbi:MAG: AfsR/SARP family transcriptional regulator, partial [Gemmatimonadaceae bacterium]